MNDRLPLDARRIARLARRTAALLSRRGADVPAASVPAATGIVLATDALGAGDGHPTGEALEAVAPGPSLALAIEPVHTGKALGRLLPVHAAGGYGDGPVVFLHTNGPRP